MARTKREGQTNAKRRTTHMNQNKREKVNPFHDSKKNYFTHNLSNVAYMQIVKYNSN
jgi:hypothetical protein